MPVRLARLSRASPAYFTMLMPSAARLFRRTRRFITPDRPIHTFTLIISSEEMASPQHSQHVNFRQDYWCERRDCMNHLVIGDRLCEHKYNSGRSPTPSNGAHSYTRGVRKSVKSFSTEDEFRQHEKTHEAEIECPLPCSPRELAPPRSASGGVHSTIHHSLGGVMGRKRVPRRRRTRHRLGVTLLRQTMTTLRAMGLLARRGARPWLISTKSSCRLRSSRSWVSTSGKAEMATKTRRTVTRMP